MRGTEIRNVDLVVLDEYVLRLDVFVPDFSSVVVMQIVDSSGNTSEE